MTEKKSIYVKLDDINQFPIRYNHCDRKNGNMSFVSGIETMIEYVEYLPHYEFPDTEPMYRPDFDYEEE